MTFDEAVAAFSRRFPDGGLDRCDFRPHFDGYAVSAWSTIFPKHDAPSTRDAASMVLTEMIAFMQAHRAAFGAGDVLQFFVGFPESVKPSGRQIFKCWVPAKELTKLRGVDFAGANGGLRELETWSLGVEWRAVDGDAI